MTTLSKASNQWATRPADQRFTSLPSMLAKLAKQRRDSRQSIVNTAAMKAVAKDERLLITGPNGASATPTNWAFDQLARQVGAPSSYLRTLPATLAATNLNHGFRANEGVDVGALLTMQGDEIDLRGVTSPSYGRIWNADLISALIERFGDGVTGDWKVPGEFGIDVPITKENTTLYASDRDMFIYLADEKNRIEIKGRRAGKFGDFARGFFLWNSEVGAATLGASFFLFDFTCSNRTVWGATDVVEKRIRHSALAPTRWLEEIQPALTAYANEATAPLVKRIEDARMAIFVDKADAYKMLADLGVTTKAADKAFAVHLAEENRPVESVWDLSVALTAHAKSIPNMSERSILERIAGKVLDRATS